MLDKEKARLAKTYISEQINKFQNTDVQSAAKVEYYEKLAKLYYYLCKCCEESEKEEYSQRSMSMVPMRSDDGRGGMGQDYSMSRAGEYSAQNMPGAQASYGSYSYGNNKEQLRQLMNDPSIPYEAKEHLRKAMENIR